MRVLHNHSVKAYPMWILNNNNEPKIKRRTNNNNNNSKRACKVEKNKKMQFFLITNIHLLNVNTHRVRYHHMHIYKYLPCMIIRLQTLMMTQPERNSFLSFSLSKLEKEYSFFLFFKFKNKYFFILLSGGRVWQSFRRRELCYIWSN